MSPVPIYTPGWRETKWSKVPCLRKQRDGWGLNPGPPDPEFEVLTTRPHTPPPSQCITPVFWWRQQCAAILKFSTVKASKWNTVFVKLMCWKENRQRILLLMKLAIRNQVFFLVDTILISPASLCRCLNGITSCSLLIGFCFYRWDSVPTEAGRYSTA